MYIYIYNKIEKRENNHFTFHFSGINILGSKNLKKRQELIWRELYQKFIN